MASVDTPEWLVTALAHVGLREIAGAKHEPRILALWRKLGLPIRDDETPWCAGFVGAMLEDAGIRSTRSAAARSYQSWGGQLAQPARGAIVVFWRGSPTSWSGHVGFVVGRDARNRLMVVGGNQGNAVSIAPFDTGRVLSYRWPTALPPPSDYRLPLIESSAASSEDEA